MPKHLAQYALSFLPSARGLARPEILPRDGVYTNMMLRTDVLAGLTVAAVLIPNVLAYALLVGLPPVMGLYAALPSVLIAALWGSSRYTITAPVGIVSLLAASMLADFAGPQTPQFITLAITLAVLTGIIQLGFGFFRLGILTRLISHATLVGFTNAAAVIIAITQLPSVLGIVVPAGLNAFYALYTLALHVPAIHIPTALLGLSTIALVLVGKKKVPAFPLSLSLILAGLVASYSGVLDAYGIKIIGAIPAGLPQFSLDAFSLTTFFTLVSQATLIALVGFVETYSISQYIAKKKGEKIDANKELVGQGGANLAAGLFGGFPVSGSFSASALNANSGAQSRISALVASGIIFLTLLFIAPYLSYIPRAILSGVVVAAVLQLVRLHEFKQIYTLSPSDGIIAVVTGLSAIIFKPDQALLIGILLTIAYFVLRSMNLRINEVALHKKHDSLWIREGRDDTETDTFPHTLLLRIDSSLLFSNADMLEADVVRAITTHEAEFKTDVRAVVINCNGVNVIDLTGIEALLTLRATLTARGIGLACMVVKDSVMESITASGFFDSVHYINGPHELRDFCNEMEK
jgi:sulfate permease, SulP family